MRDVEDGARVIVLPGAALAESDDATLARALIARDPRAPRVLWQRFAPMVFRMLRRTLGADHDLDDLAQEVFLCVFEKVRASARAEGAQGVRHIGDLADDAPRAAPPLGPALGAPVGQDRRRRAGNRHAGH